MKIEGFHIPSQISDLDLYYCGIETVVDSFTCGPFIRDKHLIHYVIKGKGFFECRGRRQPVQKGEIFAIYPGELTYYETDPSDPWTFCWFAFGGRRTKELLLRAGVSVEDPVRGIRDGSGIPDQISLMIDTLQTYPSRDLPASRIHGALYTIFAMLEVSHLASSPAFNSRTEAPDYTGKALKFLETHYQNPISIKNIADYVGLERTYFTKQFTKATGLSPQRYLIKYRIEQALRLLATTDMTVGQIGKSVGIPEMAYFSRLFKKVVGVAPKQHSLTVQADRTPAPV
ncbi:AraC family transcriptional regulator [Paenibacillus sacheonensis]|uniref:AraC family transcriptional regulator n=1 Tax=Paenibacillus sacheonensis TaxID=742054 RepID=A0A7X5C0I0_9BACL|nr:AraC family transcriptional regulator [Paenibacillus sacheonensis]MBM7569242.1 AraC family transcriptional regulator of arabinose operon [Paenibacillus sacheonensis]NBC71747.1 AraC family transcriptional regulator [Paenibacillus sacheonensis]